VSGLALRLGALLVVAACIGLSSNASADPCNVPDNGTGTVTLPPIGCDYLSPDQVHMIIDGLPPGTTIELALIHKDFICNDQGVFFGDCTLIPPGLCEAPGGGLGGNVDCFESTVELEATGTGLLAGFSRTISVPLFMEVHTGPRTPGAAVQDFPTEIVALEGQLFGDPDFDTLRIRAGSAFGLPSSGETTLTKRASGDFAVDSFFDIVYEIDFVGAPGSVLEGLAGTTTGSLRMETGNPTQNPPAIPVLSVWGTLLLGSGLLALAAARRRAL